jgi:hypothetical protein
LDVVGDVIDLQAHRRALARRNAPPRGTLYVDLADPVSIFAIDHVDRAWPDIRVRLACSGTLGRLRDRRGEAQARAACLHVQLELPEPLPDHLVPAVRVGSRAIGAGRGREYVLAAARLAYHGGYDLRTPEVLAEAAGVAALGWDAAMEATRDPRWGRYVQLTSQLLRLRGVDQLPALQLGDELVWGADAVRARLLAPRSSVS